MEWAQWAGAVGVLVLCFLGWLLNFVSLPGNWICVVVVGFYVWLGPSDPQQGLGLPTLITGSVLAFLGEAIEFAAAAAGAKRAGGATRSGWLALVGSLAGSVVGALIGFPIPLIGPVVGAVLLAAIGAMAGAVLGEWTVGNDLPNTMQVGKAAFWGRLLGMAGKIACGAGILVAVAVGILG